MEYTVFWLALTFGLHIVMVNLGIFLALYVPYLKVKADREGDAGLETVARKLMKFYAATYGVAGVYATAFTVFLLSFYPDFLGLAGHLTLIPFGIAILMIVVHFFAITGFYYGWDKWSRQTHYAFGALLAISSILIPLGFRAVFAFLNIPIGLKLDGGKLSLDVAQALTNPTLPPLYIKSIVAAVTAGALAVLGGLAYAYYKTGDETYKRGIERVVPQLAKIGLAGLALMLVLGLWYALSLQAVPYKFNNIFASLGWKVGDGVAQYNVAWLFVVKMLFYAFQVAVIALAFKQLARGVIPADKKTLLLAAGLAALVTVALGEYLNAFSQYPYFIACLGSPEACPDVIKQLPPDQLERLATILDLRTYNELALVPGVVALTWAFMIFLLASTAYFFYVLLLKPGRITEE